MKFLTYYLGISQYAGPFCNISLPVEEVNEFNSLLIEKFNFSTFSSKIFKFSNSDFYNSEDITKEPKEIMECNIINSSQGELHLNEGSDYKDKLFTFRGNKEITKRTK